MDCNVQPQFEMMVGDLRDTVRILVEGQSEMRDTLIRLTENYKAVDRLERRVDKLEERQEKKDDKQEEDIENMQAFMYKAMGAIGFLTVAVPVLIAVLL